MSDCTGKYALVDNKMVSSETISEYTFGEKSVYEVIRIINKVPLFIEDHIARLFHSVDILDYTYDKTNKDIEDAIKELIQVNNLENANIKLIISFKHTQARSFLYTIKHFYPPEELYKQGIETSILFAERKNPNAKNFQSTRDIANQAIIEKNVYEVILVSSDSKITEGSKSNLFFIKDNTLITAKPGDVLKGITRKYVLEAAKFSEIKIEERDIFLSELKEFDAAFISGTSPKVLPVKNIDQYNYDITNKALLQVMSKYNLILTTYINNKK